MAYPAQTPTDFTNNIDLMSDCIKRKLADSSPSDLGEQERIGNAPYTVNRLSKTPHWVHLNGMLVQLPYSALHPGIQPNTVPDSGVMDLKRYDELEIYHCEIKDHPDIGKKPEDIFTALNSTDGSLKGAFADMVLMRLFNQTTCLFAFSQSIMDLLLLKYPDSPPFSIQWQEGVKNKLVISLKNNSIEVTMTGNASSKPLPPQTEQCYFKVKQVLSFELVNPANYPNSLWLSRIQSPGASFMQQYLPCCFPPPSPFGHPNQALKIGVEELTLTTNEAGQAQLLKHGIIESQTGF